MYECIVFVYGYDQGNNATGCSDRLLENKGTNLVLSISANVLYFLYSTKRIFMHIIYVNFLWPIQGHSNLRLSCFPLWNNIQLYIPFWPTYTLWENLDESIKLFQTDLFTFSQLLLGFGIQCYNIRCLCIQPFTWLRDKLSTWHTQSCTSLHASCSSHILTFVDRTILIRGKQNENL